ncbi:Putative proline racemase family [Septoria linicola]|uniref:trans-L-3-hydroxyproline dehydratase n=1 Tax=Septoria linicola TaxID=215465 RepID=A0A9Q9AT12_9PEZI|nr:Putative proline racemase family [Septoria linicola]
MADLASELASRDGAVHCIDMHTTGEPTRIVYSGFPSLTGTLLEQRAQARREHDHVRRKLMYEPRGHRDMYGAILRQETEHTTTSEAHIGVLFTTNEGYSTMCGHATIALGRFLVDTRDKNVFPRRDQVKHDSVTNTSVIVLHAPCGLVEVTVPTNADGSKSDPTRPVTHISVPSFATGLKVQVSISEKHRWPELGDRGHVTADFSYGGAFYCFISAEEMGFQSGLGSNVDLPAMDLASKNIKAAVNEGPALRYLFTHPDHEDLGFLYSVIVVDQKVGKPLPGSNHAELGLCFFSDQQMDRSPTGSGVAARIALAYAKGREEPVTYHSMVSNANKGQGGFVGRLHQDIGRTETKLPVVRVQVEGYASYVGVSSFVVEESDGLGNDGFLFEQLCK